MPRPTAILITRGANAHAPRRRTQRILPLSLLDAIFITTIIELLIMLHRVLAFLSGLAMLPAHFQT